MSGGLPDAKPWASCCPRSDATMTLTLMPDLRDHAAVATLTAFVSAGPELPIIAVSVVSWLVRGRTEGGAGGDSECADRDEREHEPPTIPSLPVELHVIPP